MAIARTIEELKAQSVSRSGDAKAALNLIGEAILHLSGGNVVAAGDPDGAIVLADLRTRVADLHAADSSGAISNSKIAALAVSLCADLQTARDHVVIGALFAETVNQCCALLNAVVSQAEPSEDSSAAPVLAHKHIERYSMQSEHDVHAEMADANGQFSPKATVLPAEGEGDVEFF